MSLPNWRSAFQFFVVALAAEFAISVAHGGTFTAGNLAVFRAAASASNTTGSIDEVNPSLSLQTTPVQNIPIPGTGATGLRFSGSATSTGYLSHTDDRTLLTFTGANSADTTSNANTLNPRAVGTFDNSAAYSLPTTYTGGSGNQTRSASSLNNTDWYIGDQGGMYTNGGIAPIQAGNYRSIKSFGGSAYAFTASTSAAPVSSTSAASGGTFGALAGLPNGASSYQDFYLIQSGDNGSQYDELYILSTTSATVGSILKYSLVGTTWTANGTYTTNVGGFGLAAADFGNGANLYVTTGTGATTANSVVKLSDIAGYNSPINIITASNVTLYTAPTGTILKGIDFAPTAVSVPEPSTLLLLAIGGLFPFLRGRNN